jgi:hypothetical protein
MEKDPMMTYIRIVEDLEKMLSSASRQDDIRLLYEIRYAKEKLAKHGYTYLDGFSRPFRIRPEVAPHKQNTKN